jgi:hypothetical protein
MSPFTTRSGRRLAIAALAVAGLFGLFALMFAVGETFTDPGGWQALGLVALWLVPLGVLLALAWLRPAEAQIVLELLTAVWVGVVLWSALLPEAWRSFEDSNGPIRGLVCLALMLPVAALGWHRTLPAAVMMLVIGLTPLFAGGSAPLRVIAVPAIVVGLLLLAAGLVERGHQQGAAPGPPSLPTPHTV